MLYLRPVPVEDHIVSSQNSARGPDFDPICVGQWRHLITEPPSHGRLSACVGGHYAPSLLRMSSGCVTGGFHGDAFENTGGAEMNVRHVGVKALWL